MPAMRGEGGTVDDRTPGEAAASLRELLAAIERGEITAELDHAAFLRGSVAALEQVARQRGEHVAEQRS